MPITMVRLFSITRKMSCLSYSLPAGPIWAKGSCPMAEPKTAASALNRSPDDTELRVQFAGAPNRESWRLNRTVERDGPVYVCDVCYAGKNHYSIYPNQAMIAAWRYAWTKAALKKQGGEFFVRAIVKGIKHFLAIPKFRGPGGKPPASWESMGINANYFRWHDAGDIFSVPYWEAIKEIARRLPKVRFWVPTRQWVSSAWRERFSQIIDPETKKEFPKNLIVRPSALFIDSPAPELGQRLKDTVLAAGTMVTSEPVGSLRPHVQAVGRPFPGPAVGIPHPDYPRKSGRRLFPERRVLPVRPGEVWDCPAYLGDSRDTRNCMDQACRVCWQNPDVEVGYDAH